MTDIWISFFQIIVIITLINIMLIPIFTGAHQVDHILLRRNFLLWE
ncbi:hypothetical protein OMAG_000616 [Candidatus Omnitrophus magneticus]|uniref:Uncharacterized protein n=1 Tax=Candidatus Omnitrophus magneticus TaxID=1609969 RepID=A0A0F0CQA0_9BACT|nr:hypothetical protein OMAG_000616 [Candidatus Omnitrophus magneticus]